MADSKERTVSQVGAATSKLTGWLHRLAAPAQLSPGELTASGLVNAQVWIDRAPWRPAGLWAGIAGLLAAGVLWPVATVDWKTLALALVLVDVLWGSIWRLAGGRAVLLPLTARSLSQRVWMPYLQSGSPAARLFGGDHTDLWPIAFRVGVPAILLALAVSAVLGADALVFTGLVVLAAVLGWTAQRTLHGIPLLLLSLVSIGLPWLLVLRLVATELTDSDLLVHGILVMLWVFHHWGELRLRGDAGDWSGLALLAASEIALCIYLVVVQAPLWLAIVVVLFLPTWLAVFRGYPLQGMRLFWLAAMLVSALAVS